MRKETLRLVELDRERSLLSHIGALLGWDQETYMPEKAVAERAEQLALIEGLAHEKAVKPEIGELLAILGGATGLDPLEAANEKPNCLRIWSPRTRVPLRSPRPPGRRRAPITTSPRSNRIWKKCCFSPREGQPA
jgi:Zn-dependent M32 family carboxypeptidase